MKDKGLLLGLIASALFLAGCPIKAPEPKQRDDWSISPVNYGNTRYEGLRAPGHGRPRGAPRRRQHEPSDADAG
jgi:hypothetical protein